MLRHPTFFEDEAEAPILLLNHGYLTPESAPAALARTSTWVASSGVTIDPNFAFDDEAPVTRIIERDVERAFCGEVCQAALTKVLAHVGHKVGDYGQGMSYAAGFLLMFLEPEVVAQLVLAFDQEERYIPGYWRAEAVKFNVDARVLGAMVGQFFGPLMGNLMEKGVLPQNFTQKWFVGLGIQVLHYEALMTFWENFLVQGYEWLFKFGLSMFMVVGEPLSQASTTAQMYELLRLDNAVANDDIRAAAVQGAVEMEVEGEFSSTIVNLRHHIYTTEVKPALDAAAAYAAEAAAADAADGGDSDYDEDFVDCAVCENNMPDVYCKTCKLAVCGMCMPKLVAKAACSPDHDVVSENVVELAIAAKAAASADVDDVADQMAGLALDDSSAADASAEAASAEAAADDGAADGAADTADGAAVAATDAAVAE
ncbi:GTPase activating protein [Thecamonas trahens ATCC 50062]|uniref:GTPase activating protein n=1 Tax=Thecamonas trahens ATCC 50062 TaxID=461836 RepID=A0A0L0DQ37_THETB|nr:GTPase activating protein [Thecamonas trahens ATCC 50062]KNC53538.1 GTPase activating protein [Thecamonas trahens ATCC 50062]|eukprot:XP_013761859.1 GTPase activating protein [Thecamonas trahens ATCC 50062]